MSVNEGEVRGAAQGLCIESLDLSIKNNIPAIWRPDGSLVNVAGELQSFVGSLRLTLVLLDTPVESDPADVNGDGQVDLSDVFAVIERVFGSGVPLM